MKYFLRLLSALSLLTLGAHAATLDATVQAKVDAKLKEITTWAAEPALVAAIKAQNAKLPAGFAEMTQDKWKTLTVLDPFVRQFSKNPVAAFLKSRQGDIVTEAFVSDANGLKIAFLSKTSGWSHNGKAKHDEPMAGKPWQGPIEVDESTGLQQLQVGVPVLDGGKPIGSLVVGLSLIKLGR
jgi:sulfur relay (sulfurtransferase) DsrC/TusE family protein